MKFAVALCLLLATSGFALMPKHPADLATMLTRQQFAMRQMMAAPEPRADTSVNDCFNTYLTQQTDVIMSYNKEYTGCINTADEDRDKLTQASASEREDLINRTNNMCTSLTACDTLRDGLDFFECYRDASSDSYKTMFTLNSDSNLDYNHISASYSVIETALTTCVDEARVTYAHDMDTCDESLTVCLNGGVAPTDAPVSTTPVPTTAVPTTAAPTTAAPTTTAPTTAAPTTAAPTTAAPTTAAPTTAAPTTAAPTTAAPTTAAPTTAAPTTAAPTTAAPTTAAPTTAAPTTAAPTTAAPTTAAPTTAAPTTAAPTTAAPTTAAPTTAVPTTAAPTTAAPTTAAPTTAAPTTAAPTTAAPTTAAPTTAAPTTAAPTTAAPTTAAPTTAAPTTEAPISTAVPTTEHAPEEDLDRSLPLAQRGIWNLFKRYI
ncbi:hypothetical protein KR032_006765 [Drosophila birchii]|nr:hypothetical protein KR032_006765 [Drosophila birchii]